MTAKTILIVEDNPMNQEIACELLNEAGYNVYSVDDADSAIEKTKAIHPDLVLMDLHLPGKDGFEATRELKAIPEVKDIPIVAFTALAMDEDQRKALEAGCAGIITKPIDVNTFCQNIEKFLSPTDGEATKAAPVSYQEQAKPVDIRATFGGDGGRPKTRPHFIKMLSHDLKTPVAAEHTILQYIEGGQAGPLTDRQAELIRELIESNRTLERFMKVLLNIYNIEEGLSSMSEREVDIIHLIQNEFHQISPLAQEKRIMIVDRIQQGPLLVMVDASKFSQAVQLLLENVVLFSSGDKMVTLTAEMQSGKFVLTLIDKEQIINSHDVAELNRHDGDLTQLNFKQNERTLALYLADLLLSQQGGKLSLALDNQGCTYSLEFPIRVRVTA